MFLKEIVIYKKLKIYYILFLYYIILLKPNLMHLLHKCDTSKLQVYEVDEYIPYLEDKIIHYTSIIFNYSECEWDYFDKYSRSDSKNKFYQCGIFKENKLYCGMHMDNGYISEGEFHENGRLKKGKQTSPDDYISEGEFHEKGRLKKGKLTDPNGYIKEGEFHENGILINGKLTSPDDYIEEGEFHENGRLKKGKQTSPDDYISEGEFHENGNLKKGKLTQPNDYITEGEFNLVGKKHGYCYIRHPTKQSYDGYYLNGELFNHKHKKWKKQDDEILNTHFMKPIYFIKKIHKLAEKLGWILVREGNHKIYKREENTLQLSSTPRTGFYDYYDLRDKEIERILKD